jgi:cell wall-associated NlpC family hydrolase
MGGYLLPRDADQQYEFLAERIAREEMQEGDLLFFGNKRITHAGLALNNKEYIHAEGNRYNRVTINSFDPADAHFDAHLLDIVYGLKRVVPRTTQVREFA